MVIYVEYVLVSNFIIDFLLLKSCFSISGEKYFNKRLILTAIISSGISLIFPLISASEIITTLIKLASGILIVLISAKFSNAKKFLITLSLFFIYTFLLGGITIAIFSSFTISMQSQLVKFLVVLFVYIIYKFSVKLSTYLYRKKNLNGFLYQVEITVEQNTQKLMGFLDTGNGVYFENSPVIFCSKKVALSLIDLTKTKNLKRLSVNTISGREKKICLKISNLKIYLENSVNIHTNVTLCITNEGFEEGYDLLLHPALFKENYENQSIIKTQKVS